MRSRVRAIIKRDNTLLLVKHKSPKGQPYNTWVLPGGGIEDGELITDALRREILEETGVTAQIGTLLYVHQFLRDGVAEGPEFFFAVENIDDFQNIDLSMTSHGVEEIAEIGFYDPRTLTGVLPELLYDIETIDPHGESKLVIIEGAGY